MATWTIAAVQTDCQLGNIPHNVRVVRERLREAAGRGAQLVVFPECALTGYGFASLAEAKKLAEPVPGPAIRAIADTAAELGVWTVVGTLELDPVGRVFNVAVLIGPAGQVHSYRKIHLPFVGVDKFTTPGDRPFEVHDLGGLRVGLSICYDGSFPEASRVMALKGADVILLPTNWASAAECTAKYIPPARALENRVYFVAVNRVGDEAGFSYIGHSRIIDLNGETLAGPASAREEILIASIDPELARQKRVVNVPGEYEVDRIHDRRPEMYGPIMEHYSG